MLNKVYTDWKLNPKERTPLTLPPDTFNKLQDARVVAIIQARTSSTRFPNKIYAQLAGAPLLFHTINRVNLASYITTSVVASVEELDLPEDMYGYVFKGPVEDVLARYYTCAKQFKPDYVVRLTSDCPVLDPLLIEYVVGQAIINKADYCSNVLYPLTFPDGQDVEVMSMNLLEFLHKTVRSEAGREHVTLTFRQNKDWQDLFKTVAIENITDLSKFKISVDTKADLARLEKMCLV